MKKEKETNFESSRKSPRIFIQFDEDKSDSLEIKELVSMLMQNYISPSIGEESLKTESFEVKNFVK